MTGDGSAIWSNLGFSVFTGVSRSQTTKSTIKCNRCLRTQHRVINKNCMVQIYPTRLNFIGCPSPDVKYLLIILRSIEASTFSAQPCDNLKTHIFLVVAHFLVTTPPTAGLHADCCLKLRCLFACSRPLEADICDIY